MKDTTKTKKKFERVICFFIAALLASILESLIGLNYSIFYDKFNFKIFVAKLIIYIIGFILVDIARYLLKYVQEGKL